MHLAYSAHDAFAATRVKPGGTAAVSRFGSFGPSVKLRSTRGLAGSTYSPDVVRRSWADTIEPGAMPVQSARWGTGRWLGTATGRQSKPGERVIACRSSRM